MQKSGNLKLFFWTGMQFPIVVFRYLIVFVLTLQVVPIHAQDQLYANTFPLGDVNLLDGPFRHARDLNIQTLLQYKVDRLLAPYRKEAGLQPKDSSYANWNGLDGHVGGHYLSAIAMSY
ncbi:MAG TPA: beta-L-arabinofuranosidase domain-containing protein, partial [Flavisolibacter sp.]|nr:beta-L-arabinofuranosidase domain-containing protein [Flavisolibacter sp.]